MLTQFYISGYKCIEKEMRMREKRNVSLLKMWANIIADKIVN